MLPEIETLLTLQSKDQRAANLQRELDAVPREREARERQLAASAQKLEASRSRAKELEVRRKELEVEVESIESKIARYKTQQMETRKNEEYQALAHEIGAAQKQISAVEDQELLILEELDQLQPELVTAAKAFEEETASIRKQIASLEEKSSNLSKRLEEEKQEAALIAAKVDEDLLEIYRRLFRTKEGNAIVALENEVCTGCHVRVTTQTVMAARANKEIVHCPNCGRIVYLPS